MPWEEMAAENPWLSPTETFRLTNEESLSMGQLVFKGALSWDHDYPAFIKSFATN